MQYVCNFAYEFVVPSESMNSNISFHMYCVLFVVRNMWIEAMAHFVFFGARVCNPCRSLDWQFYYVFYSEYHLFEDLNPQNAIKDHKSTMYTWLCLMESQYSISWEAWCFGIRPNRHVIQWQFIQKSCGTQEQCSTGGAFEPVRDNRFSCLSSAASMKLLDITYLNVHRLSCSECTIGPHLYACNCYLL